MKLSRRERETVEGAVKFCQGAVKDNTASDSTKIILRVLKRVLKEAK